MVDRLVEIGRGDCSDLLLIVEVSDVGLQSIDFGQITGKLGVWFENSKWLFCEVNQANCTIVVSIYIVE